MPVFSGVVPIPVTPFTPSGEVDWDSFRRVVNYCLEVGVDGICHPANASEVATLEEGERLRLMEVLVEAVGGRAPVIVGVSHRDPAVAVRLAAHAVELGADGILFLPPNGTGEEIEHFCGVLSGEVPVPLMLQNAPKPVGPELPPAKVVELVEKFPRIQYIKEEVMPSGQRVSHILAAKPPALRGVFGGDGGRAVLNELRRGAAGTMPAVDLTELHVQLLRLYRSGQVAEAYGLFERMLPILNMQRVFRWALTKKILVWRGIIESDSIRVPGAPLLDGTDEEELRHLFERVKPYLAPLGGGAPSGA